jgi:muconolactone delta-isomerase
MKDVFLVHIRLPEVFTTTLWSIIPKQRERINKLLEEKVVLNYSLDMERRNVWTYIEAKNEHEVMDVLSTFPIIKYVRLSIHELAFHDSAPVGLPDLIMN